MGIMFMHADALWRMADATARRAVALDLTKDAEAVTGSSELLSNSPVVPVILAAAAAEAFINELPDLIRAFDSELVSSELTTVADVLSEIEANRGSVKLKFQIAAQVLGQPFEKGTNPWQDFSSLVDLRNFLMHMRPSESFVARDDGSSEIVLPRLVRALQSRGLALTNEAGVSSLGVLQSPKVARWACDSAQAIVNAVIDRLPKSGIVADALSWRRFGSVPST